MQDAPTSWFFEKPSIKVEGDQSTVCRGRAATILFYSAYFENPLF